MICGPSIFEDLVAEYQWTMNTWIIAQEEEIKDKHGINAFEYENFGCNHIDVVKSNHCKLYKIHEEPR